MTPAEPARARARILTMGLDLTAEPPKVLVHIVDEAGARRGDLADAKAFIDRIQQEFGGGHGG